MDLYDTADIITILHSSLLSSLYLIKKIVRYDKINMNTERQKYELDNKALSTISFVVITLQANVHEWRTTHTQYSV